MVCYVLYIFLGGQCPLQVHQCFDTLAACETAGQDEVARWHLSHHSAAGFPWCIKEGKGW